MLTPIPHCPCLAAFGRSATVSQLPRFQSPIRCARCWRIWRSRSAAHTSDPRLPVCSGLIIARACAHNLRHVLRQLRQSLPDPPGDPPLLLTSQQTIQLNPAGALTLDVAQFAELLATGARCNQRTLGDCPGWVERYSRAAALVSRAIPGRLRSARQRSLRRMGVTQREQLHRQVLEVFFTLASHYEATADYDLAPSLRPPPDRAGALARRGPPAADARAGAQRPARRRIGSVCPLPRDPGRRARGRSRRRDTRPLRSASAPASSALHHRSRAAATPTSAPAP